MALYQLSSPHFNYISNCCDRQFPHSPQRGTIHAPFTALPLLSGLRADFLGGTVPQECQLQAGPCCRYVSSRLTCLDDTVPIVLLPCRLSGTAACLPACPVVLDALPRTPYRLESYPRSKFAQATTIWTKLSRVCYMWSKPQIREPGVKPKGLALVPLLCVPGLPTWSWMLHCNGIAP